MGLIPLPTNLFKYSSKEVAEAEFDTQHRYVPIALYSYKTPLTPSLLCLADKHSHYEF